MVMVRARVRAKAKVGARVQAGVEGLGEARSHRAASAESWRKRELQSTIGKLPAFPKAMLIAVSRASSEAGFLPACGRVGVSATWRGVAQRDVVWRGVTWPGLAWPGVLVASVRAPRT